MKSYSAGRTLAAVLLITLAAASSRAAEPELRYGWAAGKEYSYTWKITGRDTAGDREEVSGQLVYNVGASRRVVSPSEAEKGSGTAFVIHRDGYLLTCHHVVRGAKSVEVKLGGKTSLARVVARDSEHDLALLKIETAGLTALPLGNSEKTRLSEEVRAVGYPLSTVLGSGVKVTRGELAGVVERDGQKLLHIDASVNPGNSGGPVVNAFGQVIGVASAKIAGEDVDRVGLAVPSNVAKDWLKSQKLSFDTKGADAALPGPELAERVTPAVALVQVTLGGEERLKLDFVGTFSRLGKKAQGPQRERGQITVDAIGEVHDSSGEQQLPYLQGRLAEFVLFPLSPGDRKWQVRQLVVLSLRKSSGSEAPGLGRRRPPGKGPRGVGTPKAKEDSEVVRIAALERSTFELGDMTGDTIVIRRSYELAPLTKTDKPAISLRGEGTYVFDVKQGIPRSMDFRGTLENRAGATESVVKVELSYALESVAASGSSALAKPKTPPKPDEVRASLDDVLKALKAAATPTEQSAALARLAKVPRVDDRRDEVSGLLETYLAADGQVRTAAAQAAQVWGTAKNTASLVKILDAAEVAPRHAAIQALGFVGDKEAAKPLAARLKVDRDRIAAKIALGRLGTAAEADVIELLKDKEAAVRDAACDTLANIGGEKSLPALQELAKSDPDRAVKRSAESAVRRLSRKKK
jgi:S1-C subfamily serine protease